MDKKLLLMVVVLCCITASGAFAQESIKSDKKIYLRIGGGYSLGIATTSGGGNGLIPTQNVLVENITTITGAPNNRQSTTSNSTTKTNAAYSLGEGINLSVNLGYMLTKNIGFELGTNYLMGINTNVEGKTITETRHNYSETIGSITYMGGGMVQNTTAIVNNINRSCFSFIPAIKLVAPINEISSIYSRFGVVVPVIDKVDYEYINSNEYKSTRPTKESESSSGENKTIEFNSYFNIGYTAAIGFQYSIGVIGLFTEVNLLSSSFEVKKGTITEWSQFNIPSNGSSSNKNLLENLDVRDRETDYLKKYITTENTSSPSKNEPSRDISFSLPASSIGFVVGITLDF